MKFYFGDIWDLHDQGFYVVVPCSLSVSKKTGLAAMNSGVAREAVERFPDLPQRYGNAVNNGKVYVVFGDYRLIMMPTRMYYISGKAYDLDNIRIDINMVINGLKMIAPITRENIAIPLMGCGYGEANPGFLFPILSKLGNNFTLVLPDDGRVLTKYPRGYFLKLKSNPFIMNWNEAVYKLVELAKKG